MAKRSTGTRGRSEARSDSPRLERWRGLSASVGRAIATARSAGGMTQGALAERAGVHVVHVSRCEGGLTNPTLATLLAYADTLHVPMSHLLTAWEEDERASRETPQDGVVRNDGT